MVDWKARKDLQAAEVRSEEQICGLKLQAFLQPLAFYLQVRKEPGASQVTQVEACQDPMDRKASEVRHLICTPVKHLRDINPEPHGRVSSFILVLGRFVRRPSRAGERPGGPPRARRVPRCARTGRHGRRPGGGGIL